MTIHLVSNVCLCETIDRLVSDEDYLSRELPFVSISDLKFIERDALAELFKYWHDNCDVKKENLDDKWYGCTVFL